MQDELVATVPPTLEDVARSAGVSRATVSRVINQKHRVAPGTRDAVMNAVVATGYVPNRAARSLVTRRTGTVVIIVAGTDRNPVEGWEDGGQDVGSLFDDPFFGRVVGGFIRTLRPRDVHPVLMLVDTAETRDQALSFVRQGNVDGALLVTTRPDDPLSQLLIDTGLPAVLFARPPRSIPISFVDMANHDGARLAADHLVARGCRSIVAIAGPQDVPGAQDRLTGFRDAMARHGHAYIPVAAGNFTVPSGEEAMQALLDETPDLDAVFASNDLMALGALHTLRARGRRVPEDVAVIGYDDTALAALCRPALTTIRQPIEEMAAEMARLLLEHIADPQRRPSSVVFDPVLVVRDSA
ncbi:LacI family DNA-binding transcriptional regulator [Sanguibacter sp. 25GB23B1]|uniref:LacI family DNA-binding transcriptional regulator n=1 Tax=unclassified Sanguibacter TaxID=2645534 RepID=UPI0032AEE487